MVYYFYSYAITLSALEQMEIARTGKAVPILSGIGP